MCQREAKELVAERCSFCALTQGCRDCTSWRQGLRQTCLRQRRGESEMAEIWCTSQDPGVRRNVQHLGDRVWTTFAAQAAFDVATCVAMLVPALADSHKANS